MNMSVSQFVPAPAMVRRSRSVWQRGVPSIMVSMISCGIFGQPVEFAEQLIEAGDDFVSLHARRDLAEADDVGKNDGGVIEVVRDVAFPIAQACRDLSRQNVAQKVLAMPLLVLQLPQVFALQRA